MSHHVSLDPIPCDECARWLDAFVDDELDAPDREAMERHLRERPSCRAALDRRRALGAALREQLPRHAAPDLLRARIHAALSADATHVHAPTASAARAPAAAPEPGESAAGGAARAARRWRAVALAASALLVASSTYGVIATRRAASPDADVAHDVLASHVRSLMPGHLTDVASTDRHNVKPWFNGRLDYSPPVYDLAGAGFPLVGGRVDYVGGRAVAVLVYRRRQHVVNLFVWPADRGDVRAPRGAPLGYHAVTWTRDGMTRYAVSDLNATELGDFARLEQEADAPGAPR